MWGGGVEKTAGCVLITLQSPALTLNSPKPKSLIQALTESRQEQHFLWVQALDHSAACRDFLGVAGPKKPSFTGTLAILGFRVQGLGFHRGHLRHVSRGQGPRH